MMGDAAEIVDDRPERWPLPCYDELPIDRDGLALGWGLFGPGNDLGLINLLTPERVASAAKLIQRGATFTLNLPIDAFDPPLLHLRSSSRHSYLHQDGTAFFDDVIDNFFLHASSHWDSLAHTAADQNQFFNGATEGEIADGRNAIDNWARLGIAGRAVLLDLPRSLRAAGHPYHPGRRIPIGAEELEIARRHAEVHFEPGDVLLLHTGYCEWFMSLTREDRTRARAQRCMPGLAASEDVCRYLWDAHVAAIAADNYAVEVWPPNLSDPSDKFNLLHRVLIGRLGMALGELWWLADLAEDCAQDHRHTMFISSVPLHVRGGTGAPANAIAIK